MSDSDEPQYLDFFSSGDPEVHGSDDEREEDISWITCDLGGGHTAEMDQRSAVWGSARHLAKFITSSEEAQRLLVGSRVLELGECSV